MRASAKENEQIATNKPNEPTKADHGTKTHEVFGKTVDQQSGYAIGHDKQPSKVTTGTVSGTSYDIKSLGNYSKAGVRVDLLNSKGVIIKSVLTDKNGDYSFTELQTGDYSVKFTHLNASITKSFKVTAGTTTDVDAGFAPIASSAGQIATGTASVTGYAFTDKNANGIQDKGEFGNSKIGVFAYDASGKFLALTTTDATGKYSFNKLPATAIKLQFIGPADSFVSLVNKQGYTDVFKLNTNEKAVNINAGMAQLLSLKVNAYMDKDGDGTKDIGEGAATYKIFNLMDSNGNFYSSSSSDKNGDVTFNNLKPGQYKVVYAFKDGHEVTTDSVVKLTTDGKLSLGLNKFQIIKGQIWSDKDGDAIWDANETGRAGETVNAIGKNGAVIATTTTDAKGNYVFDHLIDGTYKILVNAGNLEKISYQVNESFATTATAKNIGVQDLLSNDASLDSLVGSGTAVIGSSSTTTLSTADATTKLAQHLDAVA